MMPLWIALALTATGILLLIIGLCRAADRKLDEARRNLAGPEGRERVGISRRRGS